MPRRFRNYEVTDRCLGKGGMATVYLGFHVALSAPRAIKVLHPALADDEEFITRFEREARAGAALQHANVVTIFDYGLDDERYFIVMEYVEGGDLKEALEKTRPLPAEIALLILEQVAQGLEAAHNLNIWHRDIKPSNVLISKSGQVKIGDFGLARDNRDRDRLAAKERTLPGTIMGTLAYMSPEQHMGRVNDLDGRTDQFSLGVMAYELLTGQRPFLGGESEIRERVCNEDPPPLIERFPLATPEIETLVYTLLQKDRDRRFASMHEVLTAIKAAMKSLDPDEDILKDRHEYLRAFARDPVGFSETLRATNISKHLTRGKFFMRQRSDKREEAINAFRYVLILDPENEEAKLAIQKLVRQKHDSLQVGLRHIQVSPPEVQIVTGTRESLTAVGSYSDGGERVITGSVVWNSENPKVAAVDGSGRVTALIPGFVRILASLGQHVGECRVTVPADEWTRTIPAFEPEAGRPAGAGGWIGNLLRSGRRRWILGAGVPLVAAGMFLVGTGRTPLHRGGGLLPSPVTPDTTGGVGPKPVPTPVTTGRVTVTSVPTGARVRMKRAGGDRSDEVGTTPIDLDAVTAGDYQLTVDLAGYRTETRTITVKADASVNPAFSLTALQGRIRVTSDPAGARVSLRQGGGAFRRQRGVTPLTTQAVTPGVWDVRVEKPAYDPGTQRVTVEPDRTAAAGFQLRPTVEEDVSGGGGGKDDAGGGTPPQTEFGRVRLLVSPKADVLLDGEVVLAEARGTVTLPVPAGAPHTVEVRYGIYATRSFPVILEADQSENLGTLDFRQITEPVKILCDPRVADVEIDGAARYQTPRIVPLSLGNHRIRVFKEGFVVAAATLESGGSSQTATRPEQGLVSVDVIEGRPYTVRFQLVPR